MNPLLYLALLSAAADAQNPPYVNCCRIWADKNDFGRITFFVAAKQVCEGLNGHIGAEFVSGARRVVRCLSVPPANAQSCKGTVCHPYTGIPQINMDCFETRAAGCDAAPPL